MRIEDYALVGDCHSAALVGRDGSIDWLCWPRFDSAACFAALLGGPEQGRWRLCPSGAYQSSRRYREDTLILETEFETAHGVVAVIDFMPVRDEHCNLLRIVEGRRGRVRMELELVLRFDYGATVPWVKRIPEGISAIAGPDRVVLHSPVPLEGRDMKTLASFPVASGERLAFSLTHAASHRRLPPPPEPHRALEVTEAWWRRWAGTCTLEGEWAALARRSLLTLKGITYAPTGGLVAAPTTSLR
jgi:GH15 family glucan-1,4-alpha-glucosidase